MVTFDKIQVPVELVTQEPPFPCVGLLGWLFGHRFRARYVTRRIGDRSFDTYVSDVCERCGQRRVVP